MFGIFKKKSTVEILELKYKKLLGEAHKLSTTNRMLSDSKIFEANEVLMEIHRIKERY